MAQEMGDHTDLLEVLLAGLPEDGREVSFSSNAEVDRLMKAGEAAYGQGKYDEAKQAYVQAIVLDPNNYDALVFVGDTYFVKNHALAAGEWFARAIEVNPDRETAYRYWGDALMKQRRFAAARDKYIGSVIASPYGKAPWLGVNNFVRFTKQNLTWYRFQSSTSFQKTETGGTITVDPNALGKKDGSSAWMGYGLTRALWHNGEFAKAYPNEKQYRHSLKEEYAALSSVARAAEELSQGRKGEKLNDELAVLVNLYNAGLLEPYILLNGVDEGISKDYVAYRAAHRDVLVRYLSEVVLPPAPADGTTP